MNKQQKSATTSTSDHQSLPTPPMEFNLWGTHEEAKPLSPSIQKMLQKMLGVTPPMPRREAGAIRLSTPKVTDADRDRFAAFVWESLTAVDADRRVLRASG